MVIIRFLKLLLNFKFRHLQIIITGDHATGSGQT